MTASTKSCSKRSAATLVSTRPMPTADSWDNSLPGASTTRFPTRAFRSARSRSTPRLKVTPARTKWWHLFVHVATPPPLTTRPPPLRCCTWLARWRRRACDMKVPQYRYRCPLGNLQPTTPDLDAVKREGWRTDHILVVSEHDERLDWVEKQFVRRLGERLYGDGGKRHD